MNGERIGKMRLMPISMTLKNNCSHYIAKTHREATNAWLTESAFRNKKTFSLAKNIKKLPKVD